MTKAKEDFLHIAMACCLPFAMEKKHVVEADNVWKKSFKTIGNSCLEFQSFYKEIVSKSSTALPVGWWFDGKTYVDVHGNHREVHPEIDAFVRMYCDMKNKDGKKFNAIIDEVGRYLSL